MPIREFPQSAPAWAKHLASSIYIARRRQGLTQAALAALAGVRQATVSQAENNPAAMRLETLQKILAALNLTLTAAQRS